MPPSDQGPSEAQWALYVVAGFCFSARGPVAPEPPQAPKMPDWVGYLLYRWSRKRVVLVVDDEADVRELIAHILNLAGYTVHQAGDGIDGLAAAKSLRPDLILLNFLMPRLDGLQALQRLKMDPLFAHLKVVMFSATGEIARHALEAGALDFLHTPFDAKTLTSSVERALGDQS